MRLTQGTFSFLPDLTDEQILKQVDYCLAKGQAIGVEYTDDPHPRNTYWEMYGNPMFDLKDPAGILMEINACRKAFPQHYVRVTAFDSTQGVESPRMSYIVNRPANEPGFGLVRQEVDGRAEDLRALGQVVRALVARLDHRLDRDAVRLGARGDAHRVADRAAAELQDNVLAEVVEQLMHLAGVDAARGHRHHARHRTPVLLEVQAERRVWFHAAVA